MHLKLPRLRPVIGFLALVPFVVPPIILVVGLLEFFKDDLHAPFWFLGKPDLFLVGAYVILAFPYIYFSLDAGFRSIDVHTLTEASQSLGASWRTTLGRVILPNIRVAALARRLPHARDRDGRVHDRLARRVPHLPDLHPVHQRVAGVPGGRGDAHQLRDHVGGDALAAPDRAARRPAHRCGGSGSAGLMAHLELQGLCRSFGPVVALQGIDLALETGRVRLAARPERLRQDDGAAARRRLRPPGRGADRRRRQGPDAACPPNRRDMGMVFQAYSLFPNMTAEQNVEYGLRIRRQPKADRRKRVGELLELVGLGHAGKRYAHQLSGGMQQRVALARALAIEPRVLLLDEPLSALDAKVRVQLREEIRRIQLELGITTIYVTHDQEEALSISDRVAVMYGGRIEQVGTPPEMYGDPATPFVAEFIGTMNRLVSTVVGDGVVEHGGPAASRRRGARAAERRARAAARPSRDREHRGRGDGAEPEGAIVGEVVSHIFLGSVTRAPRGGLGRRARESPPTSRPRVRRRTDRRRASPRTLPGRQRDACSAWRSSQSPSQ